MYLWNAYEEITKNLKLKLFLFPVSENIYISFTFTLHILEEVLL